jgi:hypothetical protein
LQQPLFGHAENRKALSPNIRSVEQRGNEDIRSDSISKALPGWDFSVFSGSCASGSRGAIISAMLAHVSASSTFNQLMRKFLASSVSKPLHGLNPERLPV